MVNITGDLVVQDNLQLTTLQGLEQLERVGAKLVVTRNDRLTTLSAVAHSLVFVGGSVQVSDNAALCQDLTSYKDFSWSAVVVEGGSIDVCIKHVAAIVTLVPTIGDHGICLRSATDNHGRDAGVRDGAVRGILPVQRLARAQEQHQHLYQRRRGRWVVQTASRKRGNQLKITSVQKK